MVFLSNPLPGSLIALLLSSRVASLAAPWTPDYQTDAEQAVLSQSASSSPPSSSSFEESSTKGAVASESKTCSQIGLDLLGRGGNAVDAWVGTQLCVGVIGMHHSGIGGGGFALVRDARGNYTVVDYREAAPPPPTRRLRGLAAGVPGELRGLEAVHRRFGALPWPAVVRPAARVARDGFDVTRDMVMYMAYGVQFAGWNFLVEDPSWARDFAPEGSLVRLGDVMTRKRYAATLDAVADHGADVFYQDSAVANATIDALRALNGTMTLDDMRDYRAILREPINITYGDYRLFSTGAPSSGAVCLGILKTMEGFAEDGDADLTLHRFDEAMRFGYAAHQQLGDPDFLGDDMGRVEARLLSAAGAAATRSRIRDDATQPIEAYFPVDDDTDRPRRPVYAGSSHGTSHVVAADAAGMAVSSTTTVNLLFGNLVMVPATGVILNNEMNDFSIPGVSNEFGYAPSPANFVRPGKRPLSSINPVIVESASADRRLFAVLGAAGGSRIISSTAQVAWRLLEGAAANKKKTTTMHDAIREPRFHDQLMPNTATFEYAFDNATVASMAARGHNVTWVREGYSSVQGIRVLSEDEDGNIDGFEAVGETRQKNSGGLSS
ncbi:Glutathione hydrolase proenzyme [Apiospora kogelbergensis]|uniref:Glutathione hydrolase proenzyme n=1 Tax=Apiospora kogelbergensis TaxID=1337665 RepID=UPI0031311B26